MCVAMWCDICGVVCVCVCVDACALDIILQLKGFINADCILIAGAFGHVFKGIFKRNPEEAAAETIPVAVKTIKSKNEMNYRAGSQNNLQSIQRLRLYIHTS